MSWEALATGIYNIATADTGTGGLLNSSTPLITGFYTNWAGQGIVMPYVTLELVSEVETKVFATAPRSLEFIVQFSIWTPFENGTATGQGIADRLRTLYDRIAPTVSGFTASQMMRLGGSVAVEDEFVHHVEEYSAHIAAA
jgi:hypothetical protein